MNRLEKIAFKKYTHKGTKYTIYFNITSSPKYKYVEVAIGIHNRSRTNLGYCSLNPVYYGYSDNSIQEATDDVFKAVEQSKMFTNTNYKAFDDFKLREHILKLIGEVND